MRGWQSRGWEKLMGALGTQIKNQVDAVRDMLGSTCTLNGSTDLGKCSINALNGAQVRETLGDDFSDEQDREWAMIETDASFDITAQDSITVTTTAHSYVVRRVTRPCNNDVVAANRCLCVAG
jgi:hypothetical protein